VFMDRRERKAQERDLVGRERLHTLCLGWELTDQECVQVLYKTLANEFGSNAMSATITTIQNYSVSETGTSSLQL